MLALSSLLRTAPSQPRPLGRRRPRVSGFPGCGHVFHINAPHPRSGETRAGRGGRALASFVGCGGLLCKGRAWRFKIPFTQTCPVTSPGTGLRGKPGASVESTQRFPGHHASWADRRDAFGAAAAPGPSILAGAALLPPLGRPACSSCSAATASPGRAWKCRPNPKDGGLGGTLHSHRPQTALRGQGHPQRGKCRGQQAAGPHTAGDSAAGR